MIQAKGYKGKTVGVFGLARSGIATCRSLLDGGATVLAWDDNEKSRAAFATHLPDVPLVDLYEHSFTILDYLVVAPGVPLTHPKPHALVTKAKVHEVEVIGDIEVFAASRDTLAAHKVTSITGTNGKSTTTALLAHVLESCNRSMAVGGNIGVPVLDLDPVEADGVYVFELSSFQLDLTKSLRSDVAILLNLSHDHIDRHGSFENYANSKKHMFEMQGNDDIAIISIDDETCRTIATSLKQIVVPISTKEKVLGGVYVEDDYLISTLDGEPQKILNLLTLSHLKGEHNWQNICAVYAAAVKLGQNSKDIIVGIKSFSGLRHRLQVVAEQGQIVFVNDSKASNTGAAMMALRAYDDVYWIAGGLFKEENLDNLMGSLSSINKAYLIGEAAAMFAKALEGKVPYEVCDTLEKAVEAAANDAFSKDKGAVLLAPACASFDQYKSFEHRGDHFITLVNDYVGNLKTGEKA